MALINCPDCGKEVSDKVTNCIHCGCPLDKRIYMEQTDDAKIDDKLINRLLADGMKTQAVKEVQRITGWSFIEAKEYIMLYSTEKNTKSKTQIYTTAPRKVRCPRCDNNIYENTLKCPYCGLDNIGSELIKKEREDSILKANTVKCPKCGSTQIQAVPRKWSLMTGILTNKVDRVCLNCKHKF